MTILQQDEGQAAGSTQRCEDFAVGPVLRTYERSHWTASHSVRAAINMIVRLSGDGRPAGQIAGMRAFESAPLTTGKRAVEPMLRRA